MHCTILQAPKTVWSNQAGFFGGLFTLGFSAIVIFGVFNLYQTVHAVPLEASPEITSAIEGYCLDDLHNSSSLNTAVEIWKCNGSPAQHWTMSGDLIKHDQQCLDVMNNGKNSGDQIVANSCDGSSGESWTINQGGFQNPNSSMCLTVPGNHPETQLTISSCNNLSNLNESWAAVHWGDTVPTNATCDSGTQGQRIACVAEQQWALWQAGNVNHNTLLNRYSDGNGYEEWCADFVSYVYKQAGYPFENGERNGWDEYDANNIQNMGFTQHSSLSYTPKPGDVAFFDYPGGHVEIVVVGGKDPTFIYGDSGTNDPQTNNGEMNEDMLTSDGSAGQVEFYLSPN